MGFFSKKPKLGLKEIFELSKYPDDTFVLDKIHSAADRDVYIKLEFENKFFGIFSELSITCFKNPGKTYNFKCCSYEFEKQYLLDLIKKVYDIIGKDNDGEGLYTRKDAVQIEDDIWLGRNWTSNKYPDACSISYDEEDGLMFRIWTN